MGGSFFIRPGDRSGRDAMNDALRHLLQAYFFQGLSRDIVTAVAEVCHESTYAAGDLIFREGVRGDRLYIVMNGEVQVWKNHGSDEASLLSTCGPGRFFGEMALVDELPRSATAVAVQTSDLLYLARDDFRGLVHRYPDLAMSIMRSLSAIVRESNDSFVADLNYRNEQLERAYRELADAQRELISRERLSNLGKMSNMILHDIRNPVSVLRGYAAMLVRVADDPERVREFASRVATEAERLNHLAGELLDYSRGEIRLDMSVVAPSQIVSAALQYVGDRAHGSDVDVVTSILDDAPVVLDYQRMVRAVINLLDNAWRACAEGGRITVSVERHGEELILTVDDTGIGMSEDVSAHIFEPFFSRSGPGGTGLGMVVVRSIVEAHGGTLDVSSAPGRGTTVVVRMPIRIGSEPRRGA